MFIYFSLPPLTWYNFQPPDIHVFIPIVISSAFPRRHHKHSHHEKLQDLWNHIPVSLNHHNYSLKKYSSPFPWIPFLSLCLAHQTHNLIKPTSCKSMSESSLYLGWNVPEENHTIRQPDATYTFIATCLVQSHTTLVTSLLVFEDPLSLLSVMSAIAISSFLMILHSLQWHTFFRILHGAYIYKTFLIAIWNSNFTRHPVVVPAKSGNSITILS